MFGTPKFHLRIEYVSQIHDDLITAENKNFIQEVVADKFGPPSLIKGVQTFKSNVPNAELPTSEWREGLRRCGTIARKIGVIPLWLKDGSKITTTMLQVTKSSFFRNSTKFFDNFRNFCRLSTIMLSNIFRQKNSNR